MDPGLQLIIDLLGNVQDGIVQVRDGIILVSGWVQGGSTLAFNYVSE